jgi:phospholipid/cholesterol/gamma-HCH transport system substrate-binding protein
MTHTDRLGRRRRAAAVVALAAGLVAVLLVLTGGDDRTSIWARVARVNGLVRGAEVHAGGVKVGSVGKIRLGKDGYPLVRLDIARDFPLRQGMRASVRFFSVGGEANRVVAITEGSGRRLAGGAVLPLSRGDAPEEIDQILSLLDPGTRSGIHRLFADFRHATAGRGADIAAALKAAPAAMTETSSVLGQLDADGAALRELVVAGNQTLRPLAADSGAAPAAVDRLGDLLQHTAAAQRDIQRSIASAPPALGAAEQAFARLGRSVPTLRGFIADARPALHRLAVEGPALRRTLDAAGPALSQLNGLVEQTPQVRRLRRLVDVARPVLGHLKPALGTSIPILGEVRARLPGAFGFLSNWGDFHSTYDAVGHSGRVALIFSPTPTQEIGAGDAGPGELRFPFIRTPGAVQGEPWTSYPSTITPEPPKCARSCP